MDWIREREWAKNLVSVIIALVVVALFVLSLIWPPFWIIAGAVGAVASVSLLVRVVLFE
jgi:hypothetical protein